MALSLNGSTQYVTIEDSDVLTPTNFCLSVWVRQTSSNIGPLYVQRESARVDLFIQPGSTCFPTMWDSSGTSWEGEHSVDEWTHLLYYYTIGDQAAYQDGKLEVSDTQTGGTTNLAVDAHIGYRAATSTFLKADIAELAIYNKIPTAADIAALAAGFSPLLVMRENLSVYLPLLDNSKDRLGVVNTSDTGSPTYVDHPPHIIYPSGDGGTGEPSAPAGDMTGVITATGTATSTLRGDGSLTGGLTGTGTVAGTLTANGALTGVITANGALAGTLTAYAALTCAITANGALAGTLSAGGEMTGVVASTGTLAGTLTAIGNLTGTVTATGTVTGTLTGSTDNMIGEILATGTLAGTMTAGGTMVGAVTATGTLIGLLQGEFLSTVVVVEWSVPFTLSAGEEWRVVFTGPAVDAPSVRIVPSFTTVA